MSADTIYIVEIPHQRPAHAWTAYGEADFVARVQEANLSLDIETYEQAQDAVRDDLHCAYIYRGDDEALTGLTQIYGHQQFRAVAALRRELEREGVIAHAADEPGEED